MMGNNDVYAQRLLLSAIEANQVEVVREEVKKVLATLDSQPRFLEILRSPTLTIQKQKTWLEEAFQGQLSQTLIDFLKVLIEEEAFDRLEGIGRLYGEAIVQCLEEHFDLLEGTVHSAVPLEEGQLETLERVFSEKFGKQVKLESIVMPALMGGYRVEVNGHIYDDTIGVQIEQLEKSLHHVDLHE